MIASLKHYDIFNKKGELAISEEDLKQLIKILFDTQRFTEELERRIRKLEGRAGNENVV